MTRRWVIFLTLLAPFGVVSSASAQQTGEIFGKATDSSGAVVPGVPVTLPGGSLLAPQTAVSSETGTYRFPQVPVGVYSVKFDLVGFKSMVRQGIRIEIGFNAQINATMEVSTVQETVTVSGAAPVVDLHDTSRTNRFNQEALQNIPTARDPWVIIEQSAGVAMDRQNVGGSASGQQSNFVARGANMSQQKWNLDGVDITDMSATGGSPVYYDFDAFEEMQITTGGADVTMQTPGVSVNMVTKSGTDILRGSGRFYDTNQKFQSNNVTDAMRALGATSGNPIQDIKDYGLEVGGPIKKGRAWFWGAYGTQTIDAGVNNFFNPGASATCAAITAAYHGSNNNTASLLPYSIDQLRSCLNTDETKLNNYNAKLSVETFKNNQFTFYYNGAEKIRNARGADDLHPIEATNRQGDVVGAQYGSSLWKTGMPKTYKWGDRQVFSDRFMMDYQYAHVGNNFVMDFHDPSLANVQPTLDTTSGLWGRSYYANTYVRPTDSIDITGNYFVPGMLGGDHSLKFGLKYRNDEAFSGVHYGGNTVARFKDVTGVVAPVAYEAQMYRDGQSDYVLHNRSVYAQDTYNHRKLTINAGVRFDYQTDYAKAVSVTADPFYGQATGSFDAKGNYIGVGPVFNQLPAISWGGAQALGTSNMAMKNFSPRAGLTYDLLGNGRTVVKASFARYVAQEGTGNFSSTYNPVVTTSVRYPWHDLNGDGIVQPNEIDISAKPLSYTSGYDYNNPSKLTTTGVNDPNIKMPVTSEAIVGFDKQIGPDFGIGASFIYRKYTDYQASFTTDATYSMSSWTSANYVAQTYTAPASTCPAGASCPTITYYQPTSQPPVNYLFTNTPDYYRTYKGLELTMRKRMSNRWMMNGSFSYNNNPVTYAAADAYQDPTNIAQQNGGQWAEQSSSSGLDNVYVNAKWLFRLSGSYTLAWHEIGVAANYNARSGYPFLAVVLSPTRPFSAGQASVYLDTIGDVRLPTFEQLDLRVNKTFRVGRARLQANMDVFNLFNGNTILSERRTQNASNANNISSILAPRVLRFGVRMTF